MTKGSRKSIQNQYASSKRDNIYFGEGEEEYHRNKFTKLENDLKGSKDMNDSNHEIKNFGDKREKLRKENAELKRANILMKYERVVEREHLANIEDGSVELFDPITLKYTPELQECVHRPLENHVNTHRACN